MRKEIVKEGKDNQGSWYQAPEQMLDRTEYREGETEK